MKQKNIVATLYLKDGHAVRSMTDFTPVDANVYRLCQLYNDSGVDKIIIFDLSTSDDEHEKNVNTIRNINRNIDIKVCAGGNINRLEDIKKLLFAGCLQVILNASKPSSIGLAEEASARFGKDRILLSINNVDFIFKNQDSIENTFHEALVLNPEILDALENLTNIPYVVELPDYNFDEIVRLLKREKIRGIAGPFINDTSTDIMKLKSSLLQEGINMYNFAPDLSWEDLKLNSDGMVPVIVQDYRTDEVLMLAYMNKEAFDTTINLGKMTYWSRSRDELWTKGLTSGHFQYVKSLTADCDFDTILAKVSQVGAACHTGNRTCFFNSIVQKEYVEKNPLKVLESVYDIIKERKAHPQDGSYTNYLFGKGTDKILQKLGEECTEIVIAAKNPNPEAITTMYKSEFKQKAWSLPVADLLYVGKSTNRKLALFGIKTIGDLARADEDVLNSHLGKMGSILWSFANGYDDSPVKLENTHAPIKSVGNSTTTPKDLVCDEDVKIVLYILAESVAARLRENGFRCRVVEISVRDNELFSFTRQKKIDHATNITGEIAAYAYQIFKENYNWSKPIRSVGVRGADLVTDNYWEQIDLFSSVEKREKQMKMDSAVDEIRRRFGFYSIQRGLMYRDRILSAVNAKEEHTVHPHGYFG